MITLFIGNSNHEIMTEQLIEKGKEQINVFSTFEIGKTYYLVQIKIL